MKYVVLVAWVGCLWIVTWLLLFLWHLNWGKAEQAFVAIDDTLEKYILP